eukprot:TRINITY_DN7925_c0_g1_i3.p1 TRINITY_DN7925_c0_g1~~TRINITY_DN7925_c0_g1_i3.p1  ORF type:complete len:418 (-),score=72.42 TRINITY_DN7925_c0_g1_i3:537-1790(-)
MDSLEKTVLNLQGLLERERRRRDVLIDDLAQMNDTVKTLMRRLNIEEPANLRREGSTMSNGDHSNGKRLVSWSDSSLENDKNYFSEAPDSGTIAQGWIEMKSGSKDSWEKVYLVLHQDGLLTVHQSDQEVDPLSEISLQNALCETQIQVNGKVRPLLFAISDAAGNQYVFKAKDERIKTRWIIGIRKHSTFDTTTEMRRTWSDSVTYVSSDDEEGQDEESDFPDDRSGEEGDEEFSEGEESIDEEGDYAMERETVKEGMIEKKGSNSTNFKAYWFVLKMGGPLLYFKNQGDPEPHGVIFLENARVIPQVTWNGKQRPRYLNVRCAHQDFILQATNETEKDEWCREIANNIPSVAASPLDRKAIQRSGKSWTSDQLRNLPTLLPTRTFQEKVYVSSPEISRTRPQMLKDQRKFHSLLI